MSRPDAPKVIARLPFVDRERPSGRHAGLRVIAHPLAAPTTEVVLYSLSLDRWRRRGAGGVLAAAGGGLVGNAASAYGLSLLATLWRATDGVARMAQAVLRGRRCCPTPGSRSVGSHAAPLASA